MLSFGGYTMARKGTLGYEIDLARRKAQRRINNLKQGLKTGKLTGIIADEARNSIKDLQRIMRQTRMKTKTGKIIKSHTEQFRKRALDALKFLNAKGSILTTRKGVSNLVTQIELNKASAGLPAEWTKAETQVFYAATQKAWNRPGISLQERNRAILQYFGQSDLHDFVNEVLNRNRLAVQIAKGNIIPEELTSDDAEEFYSAAEQDIEEADYTLMMANVIRFNANDFNVPKR